MQKDLKTQTDDDFEKLLQDFIDGALDFTEDDDDLETSDNLNEPKEGELPFPKEMDDRVARVKLGDNQEKHKCMDDIASVDLKLMSDATHYSDAAMKVILKGKPGTSLRPSAKANRWRRSETVVAASWFSTSPATGYGFPASIS